MFVDYAGLMSFLITKKTNSCNDSYRIKDSWRTWKYASYGHVLKIKHITDQCNNLWVYLLSLHYEKQYRKLRMIRKLSLFIRHY